MRPHAYRWCRTCCATGATAITGITLNSCSILSSTRTRSASCITVTSTHIPDEIIGPKVPAEAVPEVKDPDKLKSELITLDRNNKPMDDDPKQIQALEAKHGNFLDMIGQNEDYLKGKPFEWYVGLGKLGNDWLALLAWNLMNVVREKDHDIELLTKPGEAREVDTSGTGVVKEETQPHQGLLRRRHARG